MNTRTLYTHYRYCPARARNSPLFKRDRASPPVAAAASGRPARRRCPTTRGAIGRPGIDRAGGRADRGYKSRKFNETAIVAVAGWLLLLLSLPLALLLVRTTSFRTVEPVVASSAHQACSLSLCLRRRPRHHRRLVHFFRRVMREATNRARARAHRLSEN